MRTSESRSEGSERKARTLVVLILANVVVGSAACGSDLTSVTVNTVAGDYLATMLVIQDVDLLEAGGHLHLSLSPDSTVSGELFVPEGSGGPTLIDMVGTFRVRDGFVTFSQPTLTFLTRFPLSWSRGVLAVEWEGEDDNGTVRLDRR